MNKASILLPRAMALVLASLIMVGTARAQSWPSKPFRMIVPYTPGGYTDFMARTVGNPLAEALGQTVVFENRPGANSIIGAEMVAKAEPDGYTLGTVIAAHSVNATLAPKLPFDVARDFTYVSLMSQAPLLLVANPALPANSVKELIALAKARPGELTFASSGTGAAAHLTMELFKSRAGVSMIHVPYKGTAGALQDTIGGRINVMFDTVGALMPQVQAGTVKALAVTARERMPGAPGVPTMAESGMDDFVLGTWAGIIAPAGLPKPVTERISGEVGRILRDPAMRARLARDSYEAVGSTPEEFAAFMRAEVAKWAKVIRDAGIKPEE